MTVEMILHALSPYLLLICLAGVTLGILWGAMPGLSTTMAMALLIGLAAGMDQDTSIMFMIGVYTGSVFGGAISAVLINIPGTPDAVPTMIEGHQLAKKGEGGSPWARPSPRLSWAIGSEFFYSLVSSRFFSPWRCISSLGKCFCSRCGGLPFVVPCRRVNSL
jgi:TctA family transporter